MHILNKKTEALLHLFLLLLKVGVTISQNISPIAYNCTNEPKSCYCQVLTDESTLL